MRCTNRVIVWADAGKVERRSLPWSVFVAERYQVRVASMPTKWFGQRCGLPRVPTAIGLLTGALCCAAPFQSRLPDVAIASSRMVVLPVVVKEFNLDFNGDRQKDPETNDAARDNIAAAVGDQMKARGAHVFVPEAL